MLIDIVNPGPRFKVYNGLLMFLDITNNKWISSARENVSFGLNNRDISHDRWMSLTGKIFSNKTGYRIFRDGMITSVSAQTKNSTNCSFRIRKNGNPTDIYVLSLSGEPGKVIDGLSVNLNQNDFLQCFLTVESGVIDYPEFIIEICWRTL